MNDRIYIATNALVALLKREDGKKTKKAICDKAIAYADMMLRRMKEIPEDAWLRSEQGQQNKEI